MGENLQSTKVVNQGGLTSAPNHISLSDTAPGMATRLVNFESSLYGGYRRISGYTPYSDAYPEVDAAGAEGRILGIFFYGDTVIVARKQKASSTYEYYFWSGAAWTKYTTGLVFSSVGVTRIRAAVFNFSGTNTIAFVDGVNKATLFNGSTWSDIDVAHAGNDFGHPGGNQALNAPKYVHAFKGHLFLSGDPSYPNIVFHSAPNAEYDFRVASGAGQIIASFDVNQIKPFRDSLYVFGEIGIKKIEVSGTNFVINDVTSNIGCLAPDSVVEIGGSLLFLSQDGFRPISGTDKLGDVELETVSKPIQRLIIEGTLSNDMKELNVVVVRSKSQIRLFFSSPGTSATDTFGIIGCLKGNIDGITWEWGELKGISAACSASAYVGAREYVLHGDYNGNVFRQESGNSFNGSNIEAVYSTPFLDFGNASIRKTLKAIKLFTYVEGEISINTSIEYDWGDIAKLNPNDYNTSSSIFPVYGTAIYGSTIYGISPTPVIKYNVEGSGFSCMLTFTSNDTRASYTIQGALYEYNIEGKK